MMKKSIVLMPVLALALGANLLLAATFGADEAQACTCASGATTEERLQSCDAVFSGVATGLSITESFVTPATYEGTFEVEESWKGVSEGERVFVVHESEPPAFGLGGRYLVYADNRLSKDWGPLETGPCSGTKLLSQAGSDLQALGPSKSDVVNILFVSWGALLFVTTLGILTFLRWRRLTDRAPDNTRR